MRDAHTATAAATSRNGGLLGTSTLCPLSINGVQTGHAFGPHRRPSSMPLAAWPPAAQGRRVGERGHAFEPHRRLFRHVPGRLAAGRPGSLRSAAWRANVQAAKAALRPAHPGCRAQGSCGRQRRPPSATQSAAWTGGLRRQSTANQSGSVLRTKSSVCEMRLK